MNNTIFIESRVINIVYMALLPLLGAALPAIGSFVGSLFSKKDKPEPPAIASPNPGPSAAEKEQHDKEMKALREKYNDQSDKMLVLQDAIKRLDDRPSKRELIEITEEVEDELGLEHDDDDIIEEEKIVNDGGNETKFSVKDFYEGTQPGKHINFRARNVY